MQLEFAAGRPNYLFHLLLNFLQLPSPLLLGVYGLLDLPPQALAFLEYAGSTRVDLLVPAGA